MQSDSTTTITLVVRAPKGDRMAQDAEEIAASAFANVLRIEESEEVSPVSRVTIFSRRATKRGKDLARIKWGVRPLTRAQIEGGAAVLSRVRAGSAEVYGVCGDYMLAPPDRPPHGCRDCGPGHAVIYRARSGALIAETQVSLAILARIAK